MDTHLASSHGCCPGDFGNQGYHCLSLSLFLPIRQTSTHNSRSSTGDFQREKKLVSNNCTSVPPCISCQKQTLSTRNEQIPWEHICNLETPLLCLFPSHVFCSHGPNVHHSVLPVLQQAKLSYLSSFTYAELLTKNNLLLGNSLPISLNRHLFFGSSLFCLQNESGNTSGSPYSLLGYLSTVA